MHYHTKYKVAFRPPISQTPTIREGTVTNIPKIKQTNSRYQNRNQKNIQRCQEYCDKNTHSKNNSIFTFVFTYLFIIFYFICNCCNTRTMHITYSTKIRYFKFQRFSFKYITYKSTYIVNCRHGTQRTIVTKDIVRCYSKEIVCNLGLCSVCYCSVI